VALVYTLVPTLPGPTEIAAGGDAGASASNVCSADAKAANLDFTVNDMNGKQVSLASFKGKVILLDFWATWCPPCKAEIPGFVELQQAYGGQGLQVVGVSVDDPVEKLPPFASEFKMNYPVLVGLGRDDLQDAYGPMWGIPTTFLISRDGKICRKHSGLVGKDRYEQDIKALL
jgi:thiol-disulfide isomerase/thioredoxin